MEGFVANKITEEIKKKKKTPKMKIQKNPKTTTTNEWKTVFKYGAKYTSK